MYAPMELAAPRPRQIAVVPRVMMIESGSVRLQQVRPHHPLAGVLEEFQAKSVSILPHDLSLALVVFLFGIRQCHSDDLSERWNLRRPDKYAAAAVVEQIPLVQV